MDKMKLVDSPTERTTAATDVLLAVVGIWGAVCLQAVDPVFSWKAGVWAWMFSLAAFSSLLGAIAHGFEMPSGLHTTLWQGISLGLNLAVALFVVGVVYDLFGPAASKQILKTMLGAGVGFYLVSRLFSGSFRVFVIYQAAVSLFALGAYGWLAVGARLEGAGLVAAGILACLIAGGLQTRKHLHLRAVWEFDHNGLFHIVQTAGLILILWGLKVSLSAP
jgi:hypothetical protein